LLTPRGLAAMKTGEWAADPAPRGEGVLQARKLTNGAIAFYYRYTGPDGTRVRLPIGTSLGLADARRQAAELSRRYQSGDRDLRAALEADERAQRLKQEGEQREAEVREVRKRATLGALLTAYVEQLVRDEKSSAGGVLSAIKRHIEAPWPILWSTPAAEITMDDLLAIVAKVADAGKLREAAKVRSYLRAAYAAAIRARQDARGLAALRDLRIATNPAHDLVTVEGATKARDRALSVAELRHYWTRIKSDRGVSRALLRFHLLTGAQRIEQLARLTVDDYDSDLRCVRLWDAKGRRKAPRQHDVPLIPEALAAMNAMAPNRLGPYLVTVTHGQSPAVYTSIQDRLLAVIKAMNAAGELEKGDFTLGDLRRTVETRLAADGVSESVRGQLQSHGLGGVQARHYDRYEYLKEKREALEALHRLMGKKGGSVVSIKRKAG